MIREWVRQRRPRPDRDAGVRDRASAALNTVNTSLFARGGRLTGNPSAEKWPGCRRAY
jgi:hypothetical protein